MTARKYLITVNGDSDINSVHTVRNSLDLPFSLWVESVEAYTPPPAGPYGKIAAVKELRRKLQCTLKDAKFLTDTAERLGTAGWAEVEITYSAGEFFISDRL